LNLGAAGAILGRAAGLARRGVAVALAWTWQSRAARRVAGLAAGTGLCVALCLVMRAHLTATDGYLVDPGRLELSADPGWAKPELARLIRNEIEADLRRSMANMETASALDAELPQRISEQLATNVWVRRVTRVERRYPAAGDGHSQYLISLEIRKPAVLVEQGDRMITVDGEAVVLPIAMAAGELERFQEKLIAPLRVIKGVTGKAPAPGQTWRSEQINAALSMESILRKSELDRAIPITSVELVGVPEQADARGRVHYAAEGGVMLWPDQTIYPGARLIWGRPPVHAASTLEASPNEKLQALKRKLAEPPEALVGTRVDLRRRTS
jgi:hypothetical protein